jgi:cytochrome d ubiquinol oxidase subunit I
VTASVFVLGVSAWYLLKGRHTRLARRSITVAASFGLASALSVVVLGDESGYSASHTQKMKLASIEAMWETHPAPAPFNLIGFPDQETRETHYAVEIPWAMGLIGTRSLTAEIPGINDLVAVAEDRVRSGLVAYEALLEVRANRDAAAPAAMARFEAHSADLGFAFLLKKYVDDPLDATEAQIVAAANDTVPLVWPLFWAFRIMVALGFGFIGTMVYFFYRASFKRMNFPRPALHLAVWMIPAPWIAAEMGWIVAEFGRQPWTVDGVLPTAMSVSALSITEVALTLAGFVIFYSALFVVEMGLMVKYIRKGPFQDVHETAAWTARHHNRLAGRSNADAIAMPAE